MNDEQLKALINAHKEYILENNGENADRFLMLLAKEIERETRHAALNLTYLAARNINNLNKVQS